MVIVIAFASAIAVILGAISFGWPGFFCGPLVVLVVLAIIYIYDR